MVYEPCEDSFLLEDAIKKEDLDGKKCLDLGTGSGIQAKAMLEQGAKKVYCVDIDPKALLTVQKKLSEKEEYYGRFVLIESDLFSSLGEEKFDFIAFNPPYLPSKEMKWKDLDGGKKGREIIQKFLTQIVGHLSSNGSALLLFSSFNNKNWVFDFVKNLGLSCELVDSKKLFFEELFVVKITFLKH